MRLTSRELEVDVHPLHGAVIGAIVPTVLGRNILWTREGRQPRDLGSELGPPGEASIATFDDGLSLGGWFPMFPTTGPPGADPDVWMHGEAPRIGWEVSAQGLSTVSLEAVTPVTRCRMLRTVTVSGARVVVAMSITNESRDTLWVDVGEHPCFDRELFRGGEVTIDAAVAITRSLGSIADATLPPHTEIAWPYFPWPDGDQPRDLSLLPDAADGRHDHIVLRPNHGIATVTAPAVNLRVTLEWDRGTMPNVLMWEHFRPASSGIDADVFALEPSSSSWRTHEETARAGEPIELAVGQTIEYEIALSVEPLL